MDLRTLSGRPVGGYAFGTMQFGGKADAGESRAMYDACRDAGIVHFDTAYVYTDGESERLLGEMIAQERADVFVATKVDFGEPSNAETIERSVTESLSRLATDYVDLLYLHRFDPRTPLEVSFDALSEVVRSGRARHLGVSNFAAWQVMKAHGIAVARGVRVDAIQPMLNLVKRQAEVELLPMADSEGIAAFPYSPLGGGLLTGKYARGGTGRVSEDDRYAARYGADWMHETATALAVLADEVGIDAATLAVAWAASRPGVTAPILSASRLSQLGPSLNAIGQEIPADLLERVTRLSRRPPPATDRLEEQG